MGDTKGGPFNIPESQAKQFLTNPNPDGRPNSDVVRPWINGSDITRRARGMWIVDFPPGTLTEDAALYEAPFEYVVESVRPSRLKSKREAYAEHWWLHMEPRPGMRAAMSGLRSVHCDSQSLQAQAICLGLSRYAAGQRSHCLREGRRLFLRGSALSHS